MRPKDEAAIIKICQFPVETEKLQFMLEEISREYQDKNPNGQISSAMYCEKVIRTKIETEKTSSKP